MIIPKARSALDFAAIHKDGTIMTPAKANSEANKIMEQWMSVPDNLPKISSEFETNDKLWIELLNGTYEIDESPVPNQIMQSVGDACKIKVIDQSVQSQLHIAMHLEFTFNTGRKKLKKDKSPGPSGVTNNQMKYWNETTSRAVFELSNTMWKHHAVLQFGKIV